MYNYNYMKPFYDAQNTEKRALRVFKWKIKAPENKLVLDKSQQT